jgi:fumarate hydratase subunit beta
MSTEKIRLKTPFSLEEIRKLKSGDHVLISGVMYMARDAAHARFHESIHKGEEIPFDPKGQVIYYSGPTQAKPGHVIGSCGPTTASRMDPYTIPLIERGLRGMIGKGVRSPEVLAAMKKHGCVYFGAIEGPAALISHKIQSAKVIAYHELGAEAVLRLQVSEMPVTVINDLHGGDLYIEGQNAYRRKG